MRERERERERERRFPLPPPLLLVFSSDAPKKLDDFRIIKTQRITREKRKKEKIRHSENHSHHFLLPTRKTFQFHKALKNLKEMQGNWSRVKDPPFSPNRPPTHPPTHQFLLEEYAMSVLEYAENLKFVRIKC